MTVQSTLAHWLPRAENERRNNHWRPLLTLIRNVWLNHNDKITDAVRLCVWWLVLSSRKCWCIVHVVKYAASLNGFLFVSLFARVDETWINFLLKDRTCDICTPRCGAPIMVASVPDETNFYLQNILPTMNSCQPASLLCQWSRNRTVLEVF